jgi:catechol 2,3-dioxygenase-like lactoylglutathione lyase family enzyme
MINFKRADHFQIVVPPERLEEARIFYTDIIGLEFIERPKFRSKGYWFNIANIQLHLSTEEAMPRTSRHNAFEVTDIAAARKHLESHNVEFMEEPVIPGRERFSFIDPFGNRIELLEMVK